MPIRPEDRARYPANWLAISYRIRFDRAGGRCECTGECGDRHGGGAGDGRCPELNGRRHSLTGSIVWLTVAHLDDTPENNPDENLRAMCQRCHLNYDRHLHVANFQATFSRRRLAAAANRELFPDADLGAAARLAQLRRRPSPLAIAYADALATHQARAR